MAGCRHPRATLPPNCIQLFDKDSCPPSSEIHPESLKFIQKAAWMHFWVLFLDVTSVNKARVCLFFRLISDLFGRGKVAQNSFKIYYEDQLNEAFISVI